jgi:hypothetical protein
VCVCRYPFSIDDGGSEVTVRVADLYFGEQRDFLVDILLPAMQQAPDADAEVRCQCVCVCVYDMCVRACACACFAELIFADSAFMVWL